MANNTEKSPLIDPLGDALAIAGGACMVAGVWWMYAPAGLFLLGLVILVAAIVRARG